MKKQETLLFYCQHSRGVGHLVRSLALATELSGQFNVVFLCGGEMPSHISLPRNIQFITLPPVGFLTDNELVSHDPRYTLKRALELRQVQVMKTFQRLQPAALIIEYFPFGRMYLAGELLALLEAARNRKPKRPLVFCTLRDILEDTSRRQQILDDLASVICNHLYDAVLLHSDRRFARLEDTFHSSMSIKIPVHYTGLVVPYSTPRSPHRKDSEPQRRNGPEVIVTAGGARAGGELLLAAAEAYTRFGIGKGVKMTISTGLFLPEPDRRALRASARGVKGLRVTKWIADLEAELRPGRVSVSQCGYNTSLNLLRSRVPALVVPFVSPRDQEQMFRARKLEKLGAVRVLAPELLNAKALAGEIRKLWKFKPGETALDMNGARVSASLIETAIREREPRGKSGAGE